MKEIEKLFLNEKIIISKKDQNSFSQIINELKIWNPINSETPKLPTRSNHYFSINANIKLKLNNYELTLKPNSICDFFNDYFPNNFTIVTKSNEYKCNSIGVNSSKVIRELLSNDPNFTRYEYDFEDEFNEFQSICDFFNFKKVQLTTDNIDSIKTIAEGLQIDFILTDINDFIDNYENQIQMVDDQQTIIDSIDKLFETLYKIKEITVELAKDKIVESSWIETNESVQELAAFILQVARTDIFLHTYLADLIEMLDKEAKESNKLEILYPTIVNNLLNSIDKNIFTSMFTYMFIQRGIIEKADFINMIKKRIFKYEQEKNTRTCFKNKSYIVFLPELYELFNNDKSKLFDFFGFRYNSFLSNSSKNVFSDFVSNNLKDDFVELKRIRDSSEPDDGLIKALRDDDIDTFQSIVSLNNINIEEGKISLAYSILDKVSTNKEPSYINYAALCGSSKCFKYLILNHAELDIESFNYAVYGFNIEIIKIVDQNMSDILNNKAVTKNIFENALFFTIKKHQNICN